MMKYIVMALVWFTITGCDSKVHQDDVNVSEPITPTTPVVNTDNNGGGTNQTTQTPATDNGDGGINPTGVSDDPSDTNIDTLLPVITLNGESNMTIIQYQQYIEYGATAKDIKGGDLPVETSGEVDDLVYGVYHLVYTATDSKGKTVSITRTVNIEKYDAEKALVEASAMLDDDEYSTEEDWKNTGYYKLRQNMTQEERDEEKRFEHAYDLVSIAKDPDEEWWETDTNVSTVFRKTGEIFSVSVNKLDSEGSILGPVDNEKLRLVVRIQRKDNTFKYITNNEIDQYARWIKKGILEVHVPDDLISGRLLVGIRPNFDDVATTAIAERWSIIVEAEVLELKEGVIEPNQSNVLLPPKDATGISRKNLFIHTNFNDIEVVKVVDNLFDKGIANRPMILKGMNVKKGDYVAYKYKHLLYSGMVVLEEKRGDEQLIFLNFDIPNVYHMVSRDDGLMEKHGLYPEFAPFRISSEGADEYRSDRNESDPIRFKSLKKKSKKKKLFKVTCEVGKIDFTYEPNYDVSNFGIEFKVKTLTKTAKCTVQAPLQDKGTKREGALKKAGKLGTLLSKLGDIEEIITPYGKLHIVTETAPIFGMSGKIFRGQKPNIQLHFGDKNIESRNLEDLPNTSSGNLSGSFGISSKTTVKKTEVSDEIISIATGGKKYGNPSITITTGVTPVLVAHGYNAKEVYENKKSSNYSMGLTLRGDSKVNKTLSNIFVFFNIDKGSWNYSIPKDMKNVIPLSDGIMKYSYSSISDDGQGSAKVSGLALTNPFINDMLPLSVGVLSLDDSSVFNDKSEDISYDLEECAKDPDYKIVSPAIGCAGWMCGVVTKDVELCKGQLTISKVVASARVNQVASASAHIINKAGDVTVNISGSPLEPEKTSLVMANDSEENVVFSKRCPSSPGVYRTPGFKGVSFVSAEGTPFEGEAENIMVCHKDENKGDPHIVSGDGLGYDFFASGDYILSRIKDIMGYEIQARFLLGYKTSWPQAVALRVGNDIVEIQGIRTHGHAGYYNSGVPINAFSIWINGKKSYLGTSQRWQWYYDNSIAKVITLPSGGIIAVTKTTSSNVLTFPSELTIIWPKGSQAEKYGVVLSVADASRPSYRLENGKWVVRGSTDPFVQMQIARPDTFAGREEGLLGNNDGDPTNDFVRRNGQVLGQDHNLSFTELYALFGTDWLVRPYESLFRNPEAIKPEFPQGLVELTSEQREFGETACRGLTGFYYNACVMDVGLSGSPGLVQEYYANTDDLNGLSDNIVTPNVDRPRYDMVADNLVYVPNSTPVAQNYTEQLYVQHIGGIGKFMLLTRPPRGGSVMLGTGATSFVGEGDFSTSIAVNCTDTNAETDNVLYQPVGSVQLWSQDALSGTPNHLYDEILLPCIDKNYQPTFVDNSNFPTTIEGSTLTNGKYTFNIDVVDSQYGAYGFTTAVYIGHPSSGNKVSDTNSYTHDFRNEKSFYLYYVVTTPSGYSRTFYKTIRLVNYQIVDNTNFPTEIEYKDLISLTYTFEANVTSPLGDDNLTTIMYIGHPSNGNKVSDTNSYTHAFRNEKSFTLYYTVTTPSGLSLTFSKAIRLINYQPNFVDNSTFPTEVEYNALNDYAYTFKVDVNDSFGIFNEFTTRIYMGYPTDNNKVSDTNTYTHDFKNEKSFNLYYVVTTSLGYSQTFHKSIRLVHYQSNLVDNSDFPVNIEYADLEDFTYTFEVDVNDSLGYEDNLTTLMYLGSVHESNKISETASYTHDFRNEKSFTLYYVLSTPVGYSKTFSKDIRLRNYEPVLYEDFSLKEISYLNSEVELELDVEDPADKPLFYQWFVNDVLVGSDDEWLEYTFTNTGEHTIKCIIGNEIGGKLEVSKTTTVFESITIIDISEIKNKTLMGNYAFTVIAAEALGADITYSWLVNGVEKSTSSTLNLALQEDGEIVTIECIVSSINGSATYKKTTTVYYPNPIIQSPLENTVIQDTQTKLFSVNAVNLNEISNDSLLYAWYIDDVLVSNVEVYEYVQRDNSEHTLKCEVSNRYKTSSTEAKVGNVFMNDFTIKTLEGNKVYVYDNNMSIVQSFDINQSGEVIYSSVKSKLNVASVFTKDTVLTPLLFSKLITHGVHNSNHILDKRRISIRHININSNNLYGSYPGLYEGGEGMSEIYLDELRSSNINSDEYLDIHELYAFGLTKYDRDNDGKIKVKELKTYDDDNVTMKFAFLKKGLTNNSIDLREEVFISAFKEFSKISYDYDSEVVLYPKSEYVDMNLSIYNIPSTFSTIPEWKVAQFFNVPNGELILLERTENTLNNTWTWKFNLEMHRIDEAEDYISFMIHHREDTPDIDYSSYYAENIDYRSNISLDYTQFNLMVSIDFGDYTSKYGEIVTRVDNNVMQSGIVGGWGRESYIDQYLIEYGLYFNIVQNNGGGWPRTNAYTNYDNILFKYQEIFDLSSSSDVEEQYLNVSVEIDEPEDDSVWSKETQIYGDDFLMIDKIKNLNYTYTRQMKYNHFHYISIEEEIAKAVPIVNTNLCEQILGSTFCEGIAFTDVWENVVEIQLIDYKDDTNQSINAPYRMKSFVREDRGY